MMAFSFIDVLYIIYKNRQLIKNDSFTMITKKRNNKIKNEMNEINVIIILNIKTLISDNL